MLKYVTIDYKLKNGNTRTTIAERGYIIDKLQKDIEKELISYGYDNETVSQTLFLALANNDMKILPKIIQDKYTIKDYFVPYEFNENTKFETLNFINAKVNEIETCKNKESYWEPKEITPRTDFYCKQLCSRKEHCKAFQKYIEIEEEINQENLSKEAEDKFNNMIKLFQ
jgi:hypothetical protein